MAARFRQQALGADAQKQLKQLADRLAPGKDQSDFLDAIESGDIGKVNSYIDKIYGGSNAPDVQDFRKQAGAIVNQLPSIKDSYTKNIGTNINEANLTDEELQSRQDAFSGIGKTDGILDRASIERGLVDKLKTMNVGSDFNANSPLVKTITDSIIKRKSYPTSEELFKDLYDTFGHSSGAQDLPDFIRKQSGPLANFVNDQNTRNDLSSLVDSQLKKPDTSADISRIGDILSTRKTQAANEGQLQDYINALPDALAGPRNEYINSIQEQGRQQFQDVLAPQALQSLNARGALFSGDVGDVLGTTAGDIQGNVENMKSQLEAEDNQFYFNAAYQNTLRQQLKGQTDYAQFLAGERSKVLGDQQSQFQKSQAQLNATSQNDLLMRQYQQQLRSQQAQYSRQQDYSNSQRQAALVGGIGTAVGGIAGSYFGPAGTIAGSYVGGQIGGMAGNQNPYQPPRPGGGQ